MDYQTLGRGRDERVPPSGPDKQVPPGVDASEQNMNDPDNH